MDDSEMKKTLMNCSSRLGNVDVEITREILKMNNYRTIYTEKETIDLFKQRMSTSLDFIISQLLLTVEDLEEMKMNLKED